MPLHTDLVYPVATHLNASRRWFSRLASPGCRVDSDEAGEPSISVARLRVHDSIRQVVCDVVVCDERPQRWDRGSMSFLVSKYGWGSVRTNLLAAKPALTAETSRCSVE